MRVETNPNHNFLSKPIPDKNSRKPYRENYGFNDSRNSRNLDRNFIAEFFYEDKKPYSPPIPELEISATKHKEEREVNVPQVVRSHKLPLEHYIPQIGLTCALTSFIMIMGALGKKIPTYEEIMGKPASEIIGSFADIDHRRFLNTKRDFSNVKETVVAGKLTRLNKSKLTETIFNLLSEGNYLQVDVSWAKLRGESRPEDKYSLNHGIIVHGARETVLPVQGSKINFLITDPNSEEYHGIWISSDLLYTAMINKVKIFGYKVKKPKIGEIVIKKFTKRRPLTMVPIVNS